MDSSFLPAALAIKTCWRQVRPFGNQAYCLKWESLASVFRSVLTTMNAWYQSRFYSIFCVHTPWEALSFLPCWLYCVAYIYVLTAIDVKRFDLFGLSHSADLVSDVVYIVVNGSPFPSARKPSIICHTQCVGVLWDYEKIWLTINYKSAYLVLFFKVFI